jgi:putative DNA primase/helicase
VVVPEDKRGLKEMVLGRWALQSVAVLFNTGKTQARGVLVFQGVQYQGKSRWLLSLCPEGLARGGLQLDTKNKDHLKIALSAWLSELGELDGTFRKSDVASLKGFLSNQTDMFRRPYAATESCYPRRTSFFASVNSGEFLNDSTGSTRFWVLPVHTVNADHDIDMQQLWAQVLVLWRGGEAHWMTDSEMAQIQDSNEEHTFVDPVDEIVRTKLPWDDPEAEQIWLSSPSIAARIGIERPTQHQLATITRTVKSLNGN